MSTIISRKQTVGGTGKRRHSLGPCSHGHLRDPRGTREQDFFLETSFGKMLVGSDSNLPLVVSGAPVGVLGEGVPV